MAILNPKLNKLWIGLVVGIIAPLIVLACYYQLKFSFIRIDTFLFKIFVSNIFAPLLSLCVIVNLGLFFLIINAYFYYAARGIILATILYAILIFSIKLLY